MTEKTVKVSQDIIDMAREAKSFVAGSGEDSLPDENLMRAAVAFNMLQLRGMMCKPHDFDDFDRAHAIALIASSFTDNPPSTPERAALFSTVLSDDYAKALQLAVAGNRRALGLPARGEDNEPPHVCVGCIGGGLCELEVGRQPRLGFDQERDDDDDDFAESIDDAAVTERPLR